MPAAARSGKFTKFQRVRRRTRRSACGASLAIGRGRGIWQTTLEPRFCWSPLSAKKRTKAATGRTASSADAGPRSRPEPAQRRKDGSGPADEAGEGARPPLSAFAAAAERRTEDDDETSGRSAGSSARTSPRSGKRKRVSTPRPPQLEAVFSPVEIDFFERAADMYADEYDVWEDFRRTELN